MMIAEAGAHCTNLWCDYLSTQFDPAHILSELGFTIIFDLLVIAIVWRKIIKPYIDKRSAKLHVELDDEHGVQHPVKTPQMPVERRTRATGGDDTGPGTHVCRCKHRHPGEDIGPG